MFESLNREIFQVFQDQDREEEIQKHCAEITAKYLKNVNAIAKEAQEFQAKYMQKPNKSTLECVLIEECLQVTEFSLTYLLFQPENRFVCGEVVSLLEENDSQKANALRNYLRSLYK